MHLEKNHLGVTTLYATIYSVWLHVIKFHAIFCIQLKPTEIQSSANNLKQENYKNKNTVLNCLTAGEHFGSQ